MNESLARQHRRHLEEAAWSGVQPVASKRCTHCGETKDREDFPASKVVSDGLSSWCRECHRAATRAWRAEHPDYSRQWHAKQKEKAT